MKRYPVLLFLCFLLLYASVFSAAVSANDSRTVRVGMYENHPKIFTDDQGNASGFWPDIIAYIALEEGWEVEYIHGTWTQCQQRLEKNEIDMMPDVAYTGERSRRYDFSNEAVYVSWSRVYARAGTDIESILDLEGKNIAVLEGSVNAEGPDGIKELVREFDINSNFIEVDSYLKVFELVESGEADAGVTNKDFAYRHQDDFDITKTAIVFQPASLYFAFPKESSLTPFLIERIDYHVKELKKDQNSIYYQSLQKWLGAKPLEKPVMPGWIPWMLAGIGGLVILLGGGSLFLKFQVRARTRELTEEIAERKRGEEALRQQEEKYRGLTESISDVFFAFDRDLKYIYWNRASEDLTGIPVEDALGKNLYDIFPRDEQTRKAERVYLEALRTNQPQYFDNEYQLEDKHFFFEISAYPSADGLSVFVKDVTERKRAEERAEHLNAVLRALRGVNQLITREKDRERLIQKSCDLMVETRGFLCAWILLFDEDNTYASAAVAGSERMPDFHKQLEQSDYPPCVERILAQRDSFAVCSDIVEAGLDCLPRSIQRKGVGLISRLDYNEKTYGVVSVYVAPEFVLDPEEQDFFRELAGDITFALANIEMEQERERAEEALRESEERFRTILDNAVDGILLADLETKKFYTGNKAICQMLGYSLEEISNLRVTDIHPEKNLPYVLEQFEKQSRREITLSQDIPLKRKDGSVFYTEANSSPVTIAGKTYLIGIFRDITERRQMQERLIVTDRLASVGELAAGIAHELNNPLTGVIGFSDLLMRRKDIPEDIREDLTVINREALRASRVARNLLAFARKHGEEKEPTDINKVIRLVLELRAYEQRVHNIEVKSQLAADLPVVMANDFSLQQVFINIIINAEHFMLETHGKGILTIKTEQREGVVRATIADDGPGISPDHLGHIFDPFYTTREMGQGTGLGLSICYGIVTEHGGKIYAESEPGKGATFIIELPVHKDG